MISLVEVATPEHYARYHVPDQAGVLADHVMTCIKDAIDKDPTAPVACCCVTRSIFEIQSSSFGFSPHFM